MHYCPQEPKSRISAVQLHFSWCCLAETGWPCSQVLSLDLQLHCCHGMELHIIPLQRQSLGTAVQCSGIVVCFARTGMALARQQQQRVQQQEGPAGAGHDVPEAMLLSATGLGSNEAGLEVSGIGGAARVGAELAGGCLDRYVTQHTCWG